MWVVMVVGGGGVQQPKPLVISWLLHWDDRGTCITSTPPEHLKKNTNIQIWIHTNTHIQQRRTAKTKTLETLTALCSSKVQMLEFSIVLQGLIPQKPWDTISRLHCPFVLE